MAATGMAVHAICRVFAPALHKKTTGKKGTFVTRQAAGKGERRNAGWLLFFYRVPSKPVSIRMKVWRKLSRAGAVQLKGAVYILPMDEEHYEFFQWLVAEVSSLGGEAAFTRVRTIDSMKDEEIIGQFAARKAEEYHTVNKALEDLETKVNSIRKGSRSPNRKTLPAQFAKASKSFEEVLRTDFFQSKDGAALQSRFNSLSDAIKGLSGTAPEAKPAGVPSRKIGDYQGRVWITRRKPFVDRMASAWLIKRFIDRNAVFSLVDEGEPARVDRHPVTFDVSGGTFTHLGDLCTFEVLVKTFGIKDKAVRKIAEIVHELDIKDDKYRNQETKGLEDILTGIRKSVRDDRELLEKGMSVFEMFYASKSSR